MFDDDDLDICPNCRREIIPDMVCTTCGRGMDDAYDSDAGTDDTEGTSVLRYAE